jgi:chromosome segregation protein
MIRLSRLSLKNFKSFRRVSIPIPEGFTAIVGPNGSGKSNIIDAICFVLGRSSAKSLRAERFSDLIFNGGKNGKPADKAEVTIYLDNSGREIPINSKEIKISRTIDTSGNSVYRLNGKRTTRNEILEILSYAKIQPDGHNIVLQGDITRIIEMNPVERRMIIDEIAGIAEYDDKKRKALRELEKVSTNVSKINAVLKEVQEQLQRLEKEKEDALRHEYLKREIRVNKGTVLYSHKLEVEEELEKLKKELQDSEERTKKINKFINTLNLKLEVKKKELENINKEIIIKEETEQFSVFKDIEKLRNEIRYLQEKADALKHEIETLGKERSRIASEIKSAKEGIEGYISKNEALREDEQRLKKEIDDLRARINVEYEKISDEDASAGLRKKLEDTRLKLDEVKDTLLGIKREHALLAEKKQEKERILRDLKSELDNRKAKLRETEELIQKSKEKIEKLEKDNKNNYLNKKKLIELNSELRGKIEKINTLLQLKYEEFAKLNARYQALEKIKQKKLSFNKAIDAIMALKEQGKIRGIHGTISELGKVNQKFSKAVEVAAGRGLEFIVVDDDATAEECINYLKENRIGRATFLPLNRLKPVKPDKRAIEIAKKGYGFALDLVDFDEKYRNAFAHIFRNTVVVKDVTFARKVGIGEARMVTLDGDLMEISGMMSGGFYKPSGISFEEVDTTKKEVDALSKDIEKLEEEREALLKKESESRREIEIILNLEKEREREIDTLSDKIKVYEETKEELMKTIAEKEALSNEFNATLREISAKMQEYERKIAELSETVLRLEQEKKAVEGELKESSAEKILLQIKELESRAYSLEKEREEKRGQLRLNESKVEEILKPTIARLKRELEENEQSTKEKESLLAEIEEKIKSLKEALLNLEEKKDEITKGIRNLKERREFLVRAIKRIGDKSESLREELTKIQKKSELARIEEARLGTRLESINEGLKEYEDLEIELLAPIDTIELEKEIAKMEFELSSLEPINMRAVEDYEVVKEKYDKLNARVEKLLEEEKAIKKLMEEIEHRKKAVFMEVFENVAMNFRRIFNQLSGGGSADLLLDEDNPLEGGLMIQAKPVGKNPQYIELMSGGEKTLTALAFIFAIQRYQPAPFYVLDEIDMFLDDDNVRKVSELIRESSKEAQFIVVSLRDALMTSASQLFGVSIEEGVSKIVGVELEEVAG